MRTILAIVLLAVLARLGEPEMCGDRSWGGYEDEDGSWGYGDWFCQRRRGHSGDHAGWWNPRGLLA